jgi:hypothetical protein
MVAQATQAPAQRKFLIATSKAPIDATNAKQVGEVLIAAAAQVGLIIVGIKGQAGPGCYNIGLAFCGGAHEDKYETFMMEVARAFFPSRWCDCNDEDFTGVTFDL